MERTGSGETLAGRLRRAVAGRALETPRGPLRLTVSAGVGPLVAGVDGLERLVRRAADALLQAKAEGRNRVAVDPGIALRDAASFALTS